jgi:hypothetical protein
MDDFDKVIQLQPAVDEMALILCVCFPTDAIKIYKLFEHKMKAKYGENIASYFELTLSGKPLKPSVTLRNL